MSKSTLTPLEKIRLEKEELKEACRAKEANMLETLDFVEDNLGAIIMDSTSQMLSNRTAHLFSSAGENSILKGAFPKGIVGKMIKTVLSFVASGSNNTSSKKKLPAFVTKSVGKYLPVAIPVVSVVWSIVQPFVWNFAKKKASTLFFKKKKK